MFRKLMILSLVMTPALITELPAIRAADAASTRAGWLRATPQRSAARGWRPQPPWSGRTKMISSRAAAGSSSVSHPETLLTSTRDWPRACRRPRPGP